FVPRRIERVPDTSTVLMRLPMTSRSRSRLMVSTSGSSGIFRDPSVGGLEQLLVRNLRSGLLCLLLRSTGAFAEDDHPDGDTSGALLRVVGSGLVDLVARRAEPAAPRELLQQALVVVGAEAGDRRSDVV